MTTLALILLAAVPQEPYPKRPASPPREFHERVKGLSEKLTHPDASVKAKAEHELLSFGPAATEQLLATAVLTRDPRQKEAIQNLLPRYGTDAIERLLWGPGFAVHAYRGAAGTDDPIRDVAVNAVVLMGAAALPEIRRLLDDPRAMQTPLGADALRNSAMMALNRLGPLGTDTVVDLMLHHPEDATRWTMAAMFANSKSPDPRAADGLLQALNDKNITVRGYAADGLGRLHDRRAIDRLVEMLRTDPGPQTRMAAGAALGRIYEPRLFEPLSRAAQWDEDWDVRKTASNVLMHWTHNPAAIRVGRRYYPPRMTLEYVDLVRAAYMFVLVVTGMLVYVAIWSAAGTGAKQYWRGIPDSVLNQSLAVLLLGFAWAFWMRLVWGWIEMLLLLVVVPITALLAWRTGARLKSLRGSLIGCAVGILLAFLAPVGGIWIGLGLMFLSFWSIVVIVGTSLLIGLLRKRSIDAALPTSARTASLACAAAFYLGYGVGWLALWGYFGF